MRFQTSLPLFLSVLVTAQSQCEPQTSYRPALTMQFTPSMPTQTAPVSTVYGAIMTEYLNVVDCNYVMVENIDDNPAQIGQFTTKTTVPYLTVYRVGCMPMTTAVTRRELRGYEDFTTQTKPAYALHHQHNQYKRDSSEMSAMTNIYDVAEQVGQRIDPTNPNITVGAYEFLEQINTALFAINIINSGLSLDLMCEALKNATVQLKLIKSSIDPSQADSLVCWADKYGLDFGMSNDELLADLTALEYAVQLKSAPSSLPALCSGLDYTPASLLGVDINGIQEYACNGTGGVVPTSTASDNSTMSTTMPMNTAYSTMYGSQGPSVIASATSAAGSEAPWFNNTATMTHGTIPTVSKARGPMAPFAYPLRFRQFNQN